MFESLGQFLLAPTYHRHYKHYPDVKRPDHTRNAEKEGGSFREQMKGCMDTCTDLMMEAVRNIEPENINGYFIRI